MNTVKIAQWALKIAPFLRSLLSKIAINYLASRTPPRPRPFSLWSEVKLAKKGDFGLVSDYTSWPSLTDRRFSSRHLPPVSQEYINSLPTNMSCEVQLGANPSIGPVTSLFRRNGMKKDRSTVLFPYFAQWFTDSFLRIDSDDRRMNTSNHDIDLCQIYGLTEETARILRAGAGGRLASQLINGEELPEYIYELTSDGKGVRPREKFKQLPYLDKLKLILDRQGVPFERRAKSYATGLERGNSSIGYVTISTLFLREHNRLAKELERQNPSWGDERLFQTARMINIAMLIRIVVEDYIGHIAGTKLFVFDNTYAEDQTWYRMNWISLEFDILYRWHGLVPDTVDVGGHKYPPPEFQNNNGLLESFGIRKLVEAASREQAGKVGLFNTPDFLLWADCMSIEMGRQFRLQPFNEYRKRFGLDPLRNWNALTRDPVVQKSLCSLYKDIDQLEFVVGLFAEETKDGALFGETLNTMVAVDAFTQALTNPVLSRNVYNAGTLTEYGLEQIKATPDLKTLAERNTGGKSLKASFNWSELSRAQ
ncbi:peroxidase family protein [Crenobacter sp. SG2303]|uniref:Peroxidase family protein n=1 Tax=Crenobacter oryzisoli TaxID=3056844 RepID=A0ABT7XN02_9NEIS|nr:peroxidase family protein [Crenobacter sp. SG2303]MDN0075068.1 peroxidase family protein [Crenobacter sp. SG2303]